MLADVFTVLFILVITKHPKESLLKSVKEEQVQ